MQPGSFGIAIVRTGGAVSLCRRVTHRSKRRRLGIAGLILVSMASACTIAPLRQVLPYPDHIRAGLDTGDDIEVVLKDGTKRRLTVDEIDSGALTGNGQHIDFESIAEIAKRSFKPVRNPCDDGTPVGCSVPTALTLASEFHRRYADQFDDACIAHDYCYRHGHETYGDSRRDCDVMFLDSMHSSCSQRFNLDPLSRAECHLAASQFHLAVRRAGESRFLRETSAYCEYRGPAR